MPPLPTRAGPVPSRARTTPPLTERVRRRHLLGVAASALLAAAGVARTARPATEDVPAAAPDGPPFDETYRGRRIRGEPVTAPRGHAPGGWRVTVDGQPLALMRRADGGYLSMVDHYQSYETPLAAARGAVDELGPFQALSGRGH